jgi:carboxyl-terminal processing protease
MNLKQIRNLSIVLCLIVAAAYFGYSVGEQRGLGVSSKYGMDLSLMNIVRQKLSEGFLEKDKLKNDKDLMYGAVQGMVASLGDPYTVFLSPKENKNSNDDLQGEFGGVGISLGYKDKNIAVMSPLPKTPAERAGILAGDVIMRIIDKEKKVDKDTSGMSLSEAVDLIKGKIGTEVTLKIYREGKADSFDVNLTRANIVVPSVEMSWKESNGKKIAVVKMYKFSERLYTEWNDVVSKINNEKGNNYGGIVLDLRNNPGGYLQASVVVASEFLAKGKVVVEQQNANGKIDYYKAESGQRLLNDKMIVVVNGGSASAAEILAGALREQGRSKLVGEKTFGKGTVQAPEDFPDGSGLHVTIAKWNLPNGKNIHKEGVTPDVVVKYEVPKELMDTNIKLTEEQRKNLPDNQINKAIEELLK